MENVARKLRSHLYHLHEKPAPHTHDTAEAFFKHELAVIDRKIAYLEDSLAEYASDDIHGAGDRALLEVQRKHRALVEELASQPGDFNQALDACRKRLIQVEREHARITASGGAHDLLHADKWWETLNELEYCAYLARRLVSITVN